MYKGTSNSIFLFAVFALCLFSLSGCSSGPCDYPDDRAKDGSRCGDRAASVRPGGRNPDFDKFLWGVLALGGVIGFISLASSGGTKKTHQRSPVAQREQPPTSTTSTSEKSPIQNARQAKLNQAPTFANIESVLRKEFDYAIDPMFAQTFTEICEACEKQKYTASDGAILYMLAVISMITPSKADESMKRFVLKHLLKCEEVLPRGNLPKEKTKNHLVTLRTFFI
ncbi:hypothetical protein N9368_01025 [Alphaproteobacteria bacterium]|nr:hypothetical protein [Alphaproteobacteria bacterium]